MFHRTLFDHLTPIRDMDTINFYKNVRKFIFNTHYNTHFKTTIIMSHCSAKHKYELFRFEKYFKINLLIYLENSN